MVSRERGSAIEVKEGSIHIMQYGKVLKRSWHMVWRYRALWIFGAILALTTVNGLYFGDNADWEETPERIAIKVSEDSIIYLPGEGLSIDLTDPDGLSIKVDEEELQELKALFTDVVPHDVWVVIIAFGIVVTGMIVLGIIARYIAEVALIRMVNEAEEKDDKPGVRRGLRLGGSRSAWRLFLIDVAISVPVTLTFIVLFLLALSPLLLWISGSTAAGILGSIFTGGLLSLGLVLAIVVNAVLSLLVQVIRRVCCIEGLGVIASIRKGFAMVKGHLQEVAVVWLIWLGIRLVWMVTMIPVIIVLIPVMLLSIVAGAVLGGVPAVAVGGLLTPFLEGPFPWIVGGVVGLPVFILVMLAPILFLCGLVEVYKSSMWTLAYRELHALESVELRAVPELDASGLEAAQVV
jgi:hypothetical protein